MSNSFWEQAAGAAPAEKMGQDFSLLPLGAWFIGQSVCDGEDVKEACKPFIKEQPWTDPKTNEAHTLYFFKMALTLKGGEAKHSALANRMIFFDSGVRPATNPEYGEAGNLIDGRLTGLLNALYASGVAADEKDKAVRAQMRWAATMKRLQTIAGEHNLTLEHFQNDGALFIAGVVVADLQTHSYPLHFAVKHKTKNGVTRDGVGNFEDATAASAAKRKMAPYGEGGRQEF